MELGSRRARRLSLPARSPSPRVSSRAVARCAGGGREYRSAASRARMPPSRLGDVPARPRSKASRADWSPAGGWIATGSPLGTSLRGPRLKRVSPSVAAKLPRTAPAPLGDLSRCRPARPAHPLDHHRRLRDRHRRDNRCSQTVLINPARCICRHLQCRGSVGLIPQSMGSQNRKGGSVFSIG